MKIKKGDSVKVLIGKDKGKVSKVEKIIPSTMKVVVENVNQYRKHIKSRMQGQKSEIITITKAISLSNVSFMCPKCGQAVRVGYSILQKGKVRICRKCKEEV